MSERPVRVHPTAEVAADAVIGPGTSIWNQAQVRERARIGSGCVIGKNAYVDTDVVIGDNVKVQNNVSIYEGVTLEDDVFCGPSCVFTNVINPRSHVPRKDAYRATLVRRGSSIGANATIVCGVTLGEYCLVGAGAVVTSDVPDHALMVGVPARRVGWMCRCGERLPAGKGELRCQACGEGYREVGNRLRPIDPGSDPR